MALFSHLNIFHLVVLTGHISCIYPIDHWHFGSDYAFWLIKYVWFVFFVNQRIFRSQCGIFFDII